MRRGPLFELPLYKIEQACCHLLWSPPRAAGKAAVEGKGGGRDYSKWGMSGEPARIGVGHVWAAAAAGLAEARADRPPCHPHLTSSCGRQQSSTSGLCCVGLGRRTWQRLVWDRDGCAFSTLRPIHTIHAAAQLGTRTSMGTAGTFSHHLVPHQMRVGPQV
eukprot:349624-Chlamydomonas_euryale.AAC.5